MTFLKLEILDGGVAVITMNSPETRNAITSMEHYDAFVRICSEMTLAHDIKAAILTGAGPAFCAGGNIKKMAERAANPDSVPADERYRYKEGIHRAASALFGLELPIIAAINGPAIGAGLDFACMCDIRIASESATFAESFVKLGIIPGDGGAWLLQRVIGLPKAAEMIFTGDTLTSHEALEIGLVSKVVAQDDLMDTSLTLARRIARNSAPALRMAKRLLRESITARYESILELSAAFQALAHHTPEHKSVIRSLTEKQGNGA